MQKGLGIILLPNPPQRQSCSHTPCPTDRRDLTHIVSWGLWGPQPQPGLALATAGANQLPFRPQATPERKCRWEGPRNADSAERLPGRKEAQKGLVQGCGQSHPGISVDSGPQGLTLATSLGFWPGAWRQGSDWGAVREGLSPSLALAAQTTGFFPHQQPRGVAGGQRHAHILNALLRS